MMSLVQDSNPVKVRRDTRNALAELCRGAAKPSDYIAMNSSGAEVVETLQTALACIDALERRIRELEECVAGSKR